MTEERKPRMSVDEIEAVALELPADQLDELIDRLSGLREPGLADEEGWRAEAERRMSEYDAGDVDAIPMEETLAKLRAMLR